LGTIGLIATTLYVGDLDASIDWYRDVLGLEAAMVGKDGDRYASYVLGSAIVVLEPLRAALEPQAPGAESTTLNVIVDRDPFEVRTDLLGRGVPCSEVVTSPGFVSFLMRDPDGNRFYITRPANDDARQSVADFAAGPA
ncbi:MAG TPA: VOC family protein, partial [Acidimicrobiales bacterium]|nr:VOC family protein [Acidimicrobiales bacterium]